MSHNELLPVMRWRAKYGNLLDLMDELNSGKPHKVIAANFGISRSKLSKFVDNTFLVRYVVKPEIAEAIEEIEAAKAQRMVNAKREALKILNLSGTPYRKAENDDTTRS